MQGILHLRTIRPEDNSVLANIIRSALEEFGANKPGTVYYDPTTDALYELFQTPGSAYFVATLDNVVVGGAGFFPTEGLPESIVELVKMYLMPSARGLGLGRKLVEMAEANAVKGGNTGMYLESMPELKSALSMYEKLGYSYIDAPMGNSGHTGCDLWMFKSLI